MMVRKAASFLRWRMKPVRWAAKGINSLVDLPRLPRQSPRTVPASSLADRMERDGHVKLPRRIDLPEIDLSALAGLGAGTAFVDVRSRFADMVTGTFVDLVSDRETADLILAYFDGQPWLWNVSLNYSDPSAGITDSQFWHFDYGDTRQLHLMVYFSDVTLDSGPFTFLPAPLSQRVPRHPLVIERLSDADLERTLGIGPGEAIRLTGQRGDIFAGDPGRLLHQGARCSTQRLVMFVSFSTRAPMSKGGAATLTRGERAQFGAAYARRAGSGAILPMAAFA